MNEENFRSYRRDTMSHFSQYHNHKERIAWLATAVYFSAIVWLFQAKDDPGPIRYLVIGTLFFVVWFVWWQLEKRAIASFIVAGCANLLAGDPRPDGHTGPFYTMQLPQPLADECQKVDVKTCRIQEARAPQTITGFVMLAWLVVVVGWFVF